MLRALRAVTRAATQLFVQNVEMDTQKLEAAKHAQSVTLAVKHVMKQLQHVRRVLQDTTRPHQEKVRAHPAKVIAMGSLVLRAA